MKLCNTCQEVKFLSDFYSRTMTTKSKGTFMYYHPECKTCTKKRSKRWQQDPDNYKKVMSNVRNQNAKESSRICKRNNSRKRRKAGYQLEYYKSNPGKFRSYRDKRIEEKKHEITLTEWEFCMMYFNFSCAYCGASWENHFSSVGQDLHREHVIVNGKNDLSNCIPSCRDCNSEKWEHSFNTWYNIDNYRYTRERYLRIYQWLRHDYRRIIEPKIHKSKVKKQDKM